MRRRRAAAVAVSSEQPRRDRMWCHGTRKGRPGRGRGRRMRRHRSAAMQRQLSLPTPRLSARLSRAPLASCRGRHAAGAHFSDVQPTEQISRRRHRARRLSQRRRLPVRIGAPKEVSTACPEDGQYTARRASFLHRAYSPSMSSRRVLRRKEKKSGAAHRSGAIVPARPASACRDTFHQQQHNTFGLRPAASFSRRAWLLRLDAPCFPPPLAVPAVLCK